MKENEEYTLDFLIKKFDCHANEYANSIDNSTIEFCENYFNLPKALKIICQKLKEHDERI